MKRRLTLQYITPEHDSTQVICTKYLEHMKDIERNDHNPFLLTPPKSYFGKQEIWNQKGFLTHKHFIWQNLLCEKIAVIRIKLGVSIGGPDLPRFDSGIQIYPMMCPNTSFPRVTINVAVLRDTLQIRYRYQKYVYIFHPCLYIKVFPHLENK